MTKSVDIEKPALAYQNFSLSIHCPGMDWSKALVIGWHWRMVASTEPMQYAITQQRTNLHSHLNSLLGKTLR